MIKSNHEMSFVCGERFNRLAEKVQQDKNKTSKLMEKSDDDIVTETNGYKMTVHNGTCEHHAKQGSKFWTFWRNPFDVESYEHYKKIQSTYGLYEGTWVEVKRMRYEEAELINDEAGDMLVVSINW